MAEKRKTASSRTCPHCREPIHLEATRCKHCQSWLAGGAGWAGQGETGPTVTGPTVTDMGPADENTVVPLTSKSCGGCQWEGGVGGFLHGGIGHGVRHCTFQHCLDR